VLKNAFQHPAVSLAGCFFSNLLGAASAASSKFEAPHRHRAGDAPYPTTLALRCCQLRQLFTSHFYRVTGAAVEFEHGGAAEIAQNGSNGVTAIVLPDGNPNPVVLHANAAPHAMSSALSRVAGNHILRNQLRQLHQYPFVVGSQVSSGRPYFDGSVVSDGQGAVGFVQRERDAASESHAVTQPWRRVAQADRQQRVLAQGFRQAT